MHLDMMYAPTLGYSLDVRRDSVHLVELGMCMAMAARLLLAVGQQTEVNELSNNRHASCAAQVC